MRFSLWLAAGLIGAPVCGALYQKLGEWSDRRRHRRGGRLIPLEHGAVYLRETGTERDAVPAVIFESGIGATSQNWVKVQREVATHSRTVSYDRAGLGWSTAAVSDPTPPALARNLLLLLESAQIPGPYILVGHSYGGLVARRFAAEYPELVAGLVLVDPMRPTDWPPLNESGRQSLERAIKLTGVCRVAARVGASRLFMRSMLLGSGRVARLLCRLGGEPAETLMDRMLCEVGKMPREIWPSVAANWSRPRFFETLAAYLRAIPETVTGAHRVPALDLEVAVLTRASARPLSEAELRAISRNARQILAPRSAHWIHLDEPELVLGAIRDMLARSRAGQSQHTALEPRTSVAP